MLLGGEPTLARWPSCSVRTHSASTGASLACTGRVYSVAVAALLTARGAGARRSQQLADSHISHRLAVRLTTLSTLTRTHITITLCRCATHPTLPSPQKL